MGGTALVRKKLVSTDKLVELLLETDEGSTFDQIRDLRLSVKGEQGRSLRRWLWKRVKEMGR